jgi:hypothetical protein
MPGAVNLKLITSVCPPTQQTEHAMALEPLATKGNVLHIYDFRVKEGTADEFIKLFEEFDYSPENPMHKSAAQ